jgi:hypothetical protein
MVGVWGRVAGGLIGAAALAAVGCGSSSGGGSIPFSQFEASYDQASCRLLVLCGEFPDQATCLSSDHYEPHDYATLDQDISTGKVMYDGAKAQACLDAYNAVSSCNRKDVGNIAPNPDCHAVFTGTVAAGGACFASAECAGGGTCWTGGTCAPQYECCPGTCLAAPPTVALGGDCSSAATVCVWGTVCTVDLTKGGETCQPFVGVGASCVYSINESVCASPLYCDSTTGVCNAPVATGGPCDPSRGSLDCDIRTDRCDTTTLVCTPPLAVGAPCSNATDNCAAYATCDATTNTCVQRPAVGQACDRTNGPPCLGDTTTCDSTSATCVRMPAGGACS